MLYDEMRGTSPFLRDSGHPSWSAIVVIVVGLVLVFALMPLMIRL
jgi:hypothetical protein